MSHAEAIDVHAHVIPPDIPFGCVEPRFPRLEIETAQCHLVSGSHRRTTRAGAWDLDARTADMDALGIDVQVLSPLPELLCYWAPEDEAVRYCRAVNEWLSRALAEPEHRRRFVGLGIVPMQFPGRAASMLSELRDLGLLGVELGTSIGGSTVADVRFDDVFAEAARLDLGVFVHPHQPAYADAFTPPIVAGAVLFPGAMTNAVLGLIARGHLVRSPTLRLLHAHGGGATAFALDRLSTTWEISDALRSCIPEEPLAYARRMWFDSLVWGDAPLQYLAGVVGSDRVLFGTDYPFGHDLITSGDALATQHGTGDARRWIGG